METLANGGTELLDCVVIMSGPVISERGLESPSEGTGVNDGVSHLMDRQTGGKTGGDGVEEVCVSSDMIKLEGTHEEEIDVFVTTPSMHH